MFCRIQNLYISQTVTTCFFMNHCFVEFKIYISLKHMNRSNNLQFVLQNSKFTYLSNIIRCCLMKRQVLQNSKFTYLSNIGMVKIVERQFCRIQNLHISQTCLLFSVRVDMFCRIQNLHISQTNSLASPSPACFVEFKIYISLKHIFL